MTTDITPPGKPIGVTKLIPSAGVSPTKYKPAADPLIETVTPLSSTGNTGRRLASTPPTAFWSELARATVDLTIPNSPGAKPAGSPGDGLGVGVGLALGVALAN